MVQSKEQNKSPEIDPKKKSSNPSMNYLAKNSKLVHCAQNTDKQLKENRKTMYEQNDA